MSRRGIRADQHQKVFGFRQGDIIAYPAGVAHWCYNDGDSPVQAIVVHDTSSNWNQLGRHQRSFKLAGSEKISRGHRVEEEMMGSGGDNIFSGFDEELLAEVLGVNREVVSKIQNPDPNRGRIVRVESGALHFLHPSRRSEEEQHRRASYEEEEQRRRSTPSTANGIDEAFCQARLRENIDDPQRADVFNPRGGRLTTLNSNKLPILALIQMSAVRGILYRGAYHAPHWNLNAHSVVVATGGRGRLQIVDNRGRNVFDGELRSGQLVVVPQGFAAVKQAGEEEGFEWVAFKTTDRAVTSPIVGKTSVLRGIPEDVLANSFQISRHDALRLKFTRGEELAILAPRSWHGGRFLE